MKDGRDEPPLALDGGEDGFKFFYSLAKNAYLALEKEGFLLCEIGDGQAETVAKIFVNAGFKNATFYQDLSRKTRVVEVHKIE